MAATNSSVMSRLCISILAGLALGITGCDSLTTVVPEANEVFDGPVDGLTPSQFRTHAAGDEAFGDLFVPATGLGPVFNQTTCVTCHPGEGRAHPSTNLRRFGRERADGSFDTMIEFGGPQLQDRSVPGYPAEVLPDGITGLSARGGPIVVGLGLIEAIPDEAILSREDPTDANGDGISGRANFVIPPDYLVLDGDRVVRDGRYLGRFGRKATAINLFQQTVTAYKQDIGVTSDFEPEDLFNPAVGRGTGDIAPDPEVPAGTVNDVVFYLQTLRPPMRRNASDPLVLEGERLFSEIGCAGCHVPQMESGYSSITPLSLQPVRLFSDLLLHDMGPALADNFPEGDATGVEWRTPPLWGLGIVENLLGGTPFYLHDGRTSDLSQVIALHGGEASNSRDGFHGLTEAARGALIAFLKSL